MQKNSTKKISMEEWKFCHLYFLMKLGFYLKTRYVYRYIQYLYMQFQLIVKKGCLCITDLDNVNTEFALSFFVFSSF